MNKILFLSFYLFFNLISYSQSNSKIELFDLVKIFIPQKENTYKDWFTGAEDGSPIDWKTEGTRLYQQLPKECHDNLQVCEPLRYVPAERPKQQEIYKYFGQK